MRRDEPARRSMLSTMTTHERTHALRSSRLVLAASAILLLVGLGCDREEGPKAAAPGEPAPSATAEVNRAVPQAIAEVPVVEVARMVEENRGVLFDANTESTREREGIVPGAVLLTSSSEYELSLLPSEKSTPLVFYCANTRCTASDRAAERARDAGYANVAVMREGIAGWKAAGHPTAPPKG